MISIHTPAKGVTGGGLSGTLVYTISIHTPAKGVTENGYIYGGRAVYFNPHPREGGDMQLLQGDCLELIFQSTPPRRG